MSLIRIFTGLFLRTGTRSSAAKVLGLVLVLSAGILTAQPAGSQEEAETTPPAPVEVRPETGLSEPPVTASAESAESASQQGPQTLSQPAVSDQPETPAGTADANQKPSGTETTSASPTTSTPSTETPTTTSPSPESAPAESSSLVQPSSSVTPATTEPPPLTMGPNGRLVLNFKDAPVEAVLDQLSEAAGLIILKTARIEGRITLISRQPLTLDETVALLNSVLKERGLAAVRSERLLRLIPLEEAKKSTIPVRTGNDPDQIPATDEVITQIIPVRYADATQLRRDLASLLSSYADMTANASSNSLILTDTSANVKRIVEIVRAVDTTMSGVSQVRVFQLKYANAATTARLITEIFRIDQAGGMQGQFGPFGFFQRFTTGRGGPGTPGAPAVPGFPGFPGAPAGQQTGAGAGEGGRVQARVTAAADERTNTLVVSAPPDLMLVIEGIIRELDANPAQDQEVFIYRLKNAQATNVADVVNSLFGNTTTRTGTGTTRTGTSTRTGTQGTTGMRSTGSGATGQTSPFGQTGTLAQAQRTTTTTPTARTTAVLSPAAQQAAAGLAGQVTVVADPDTNSLVVMTASANIPRVRMILEELDRPIPQVVIKALIAEVTHENAQDLGVEFSVINLKGDRDIRIFSDFGVEAAQNTAGGLFFKLVETDVDLAIRALQSVGKIDVLSRPYILASDNQTATITVGQRVPFITNTRTTETGQTINTIQYEDIGIILNVTPHINPDGLVIMDVAPEISSLTKTTVPISETVNAVVFNKRAASSRVAIRDGQTIVIGGLIEDRLVEQTSKVPVVGDIPLLGLLFQRNETTKAKTELLIFLTPHVAPQPELLQRMSDDEKKGHVVVPRAVEPGTFERHLEGLQRGAAQPRAQE